MKALLHIAYTGLLTLLLAACVAAPPVQAPAIEATTEATTIPETQPGVTRIVTDIRGIEVEIPADPQRIVVVDYNAVEEVVALGIKPVGILYDHGDYLDEELEGVTVVGDEGTPNLETLLQIKPDLIIALDWWIDDTVIAQLSEIAPTVMIDRQNFRDWKQYLRNMGELLGRSEKAEELLAEYDAHVAEVRAAIGEEFVANNEVTLFVGYEDTVRIWVDSFPNTVLNDLGLRIPQAQVDALAANPADPERLDDLSLEEIPLLDADVIFYLSVLNEFNTEFNTKLAANPLWQQLPAVQAGKAYGVDAPWNEGSIIAANLLLDTLEEYLAQ